MSDGPDGGSGPDEAEIEALRALRRQISDPVLRGVLSSYERGAFRDPGARARLRLALAPQSESEAESISRLTQQTSDVTLKRLLNCYQRGGFDDPHARTLLNLAAGGRSSELAAARALAVTTRDDAVRTLANRFVAGTLDTAALAAVMEYIGSEDREQAAVRLLLRTTTRRSLAQLLRRFDQAGENEAVGEALDLMASAGDLRRFCIVYLKRTLNDKTVSAVLTKYLAGELTENDRLRLIRELMKDEHYVADLFGTLANANWLHDESFKDAYNAGVRVDGRATDIRWRRYTLMCCARAAIRNEGNFVECGVDRGGSAMCVISALGEQAFSGRMFYLFDTFAGLVREQLDDAERELTRITDERYPDSYEHVVRSFAGLGFVKVVRGTVPETLAAYDGGPVAYLHIDMNVARPERAAFEYFWPALVRGAPVVFDDYGFPFHRRQKASLDAAARELGVEIMMLPTGQGLVWK